MKNLGLFVLIVISFILTACLGHRDSGAKTSSIVSGDPVSGTGGGFQALPPDDNQNDNGSGVSYKGRVTPSTSPVGSAFPSMTGNPSLTPGQEGVTPNPNVTQPAGVTQTPVTDPLPHPGGITLVNSLAGDLAGLYACGNYIYAVTKYSGAIKSNSSVKQNLHQLKVAKNYDRNFATVSLKKSGNKEAPYLLEGLTCVNNQWLSGTYRYMEGNVWYEYIFIYNPVDKSVPLREKIHTSASTTDLTAWRTSDIRNENQTTNGLAVDAVKPDLIKVAKMGDDTVLIVFKEKYKFDRFILTNGLLNSITKVQNSSLLSSVSSSGAYYGATLAQIPGSNDLVSVKLEKGMTAPNIYRWTYNAAAGKKITLSNVYAISGKANIDANVVRSGEKLYLIYRDTSKGTMQKIYDLGAGLTGTTFDGATREVKFSSTSGGIKVQGNKFIEQAVYTNDGTYAFIQTNDQLATFIQGTYLTTTDISESSFPLPERYTYLLKYKELKKIAQQYASTAAWLAGGTSSDEVYLSFPYNGKALTYKGKLAEFAEWANNLP